MGLIIVLHSSQKQTTNLKPFPLACFAYCWYLFMIMASYKNNISNIIFDIVIEIRDST